MLIHKHWVVGTGILVAGSLGAIPFQRHATDGNQINQNLSVPIDQSIVQTAPFEPLESAHPIPDGTIESPASTLYLTSQQQRESVARTPLTPPTISLMPARAPEIGDHYPNDGNSQSTAAQVAKLNLSGSKPEILSTYTIQDGDTLTGIAEHFLGQANLADWIYYQNKMVIARPELLPIGAEIIIPAPPADGVFSEISSTVNKTPEQGTESPQVIIRQPVPPAPKALDD